MDGVDASIEWMGWTWTMERMQLLEKMKVAHFDAEME